MTGWCTSSYPIYYYASFSTSSTAIYADIRFVNTEDERRVSTGSSRWQSRITRRMKEILAAYRPALASAPELPMPPRKIGQESVYSKQAPPKWIAGRRAR